MSPHIDVPNLPTPPSGRSSPGARDTTDIHAADPVPSVALGEEHLNGVQIPLVILEICPVR